MRPVTGRAVASLFTSAKEHGLVFLSQKDQGFQIVCLLMGPVAKRLVCAQATGAPRIFFTSFTSTLYGLFWATTGSVIEGLPLGKT